MTEGEKRVEQIFETTFAVDSDLVASFRMCLEFWEIYTCWCCAGDESMNCAVFPK